MAESKICSQCNQSKPLEDFYRYKKGAFGRRAACKACVYERYGKQTRNRAREWGRRNPVRNRERAHNWQNANKERKRRSLEHLKAWLKNNPKRVALNNYVHARARYARKRQAMPRWANLSSIKAFYRMAKERSDSTGERWQVDHIVPLRSKRVCGLHCEDNLRILPASVNAAKANRFWPDMP